MVSRFSNRRKLIGSRRKFYRGGSGEETQAAVEADAASAATTPTGEASPPAEKNSKTLRDAAKKAAQDLVNSKNFDVVFGENEEDRTSPFYERCAKSTDLVNQMKEQLGEEKKVHLEKLVEAEKEMLLKRQEAVKAQAAFNFLTQKAEDFEVLNKKLATLKEQINLAVADANKLNSDCNNELSSTSNQNMKDLIAEDLERLETESKATQDSMASLLESVAKDLKSKLPNKDGSKVTASNDTAPTVVAKDGEIGDSDEETSLDRIKEGAVGGRYRRSKKLNLRKRRSFNKFW
jgi:hypothetical protein